MRNLILALTLLATPAAHADEKMAQLCANGAEGTAQGTLERLGTARLSLVCIDKDRMAGTAAFPNQPFISMTFSAVDDGTLVLSQFPLGSDDRKGIASSTNMNYVRVNVEALASGRAAGYMIGGTLSTPLGFNGQVIQRFPSVAKMASKPISHQDFAGTYTFVLPEANGDASNALLWADVIQGVPVFTLTLGDPSAPQKGKGSSSVGPWVTIHLVDGPVWDGQTGFMATNAIGDTTQTGTALWHIRGRVVDVGTLEIYLIDSKHGLRGPFLAKKISDPRNKLLAP